jgi:hypothetical protein
VPSTTQTGGWEFGGETSPALRLAAVTAFAALYLVLFFLDPTLFGAQSYYWLSGLLGLVLAGFAGRAARERSGTMRVFFVFLAVSFVAFAVESFTYQQGFYLEAVCGEGVAGGDCVPPEKAASAWMIAFLVFLFAWNCAWGLLALELLRRSRAPLLVKALAMGMLITLSTLFLMFYREPQTREWETLGGRFEIVTALLELSGLMLCLTCVLLGARRAFVLLTAGFGVFGAADFVVLQLERRAGQIGLLDKLDFLWMMGLFLFLAGFVLLRRPEGGGREDLEAAASKLSGLSGILLLISMGTVLLSAVANRLLEDAWLPFFLVLFTVACVILMTRITAGVDRAIRFSEEYSRELLRPGLEPVGWSERAGGLRGALETTGLAELLDVLGSAAARLRDEVIFLGPERLNRPALRRRDGRRATCFLVMPFSFEWSDEAQSLIRRSCELEGVHAIRGDDLFTPTDILDDIWQGIAGADFVIADITGRNPNVFYELGMAHAIAKPVVILSQFDADLPVDLATRRVIRYERSELQKGQDAALMDRLGKTIQQVCRDYGFTVHPEAVAPPSVSMASPQAGALETPVSPPVLAN